MFRTSLATLVLFASLNATVFAAQPTLDDAIADLGHRWARVSYQTPEAAREAAFGPLIAQTRQVAQSYPGRAEPMIWEAIVLASAAKAEGGLGALAKVKEARDLLLAAEKINPTALHGSAYNSLGSLYAKVPRWPIGFGDKKKATEYFEKALALNPDGIDPNYFYADLLADEGEYALAADHLKRALAAPARPGREDADAGRRQEAMQLLESLRQKHGDQLAGK
jgi:tetratricopeptide (TPR) repeat protein